MPWQNCSNAGLKKNRGIFLSLLLGIFLGSLYRANGLEHTCVATSASPGEIHCLVSFREEELRQIQEALRDGYRVEIDFVIRVYETQKPSLFGDTLRVELKHTYTVRWDPVGKEYALTASTGEKRFFPSWETFLSYFSRSPRFPIPSIPGKTIFGLSQVVLKPQLFNPPLQILNVVGHAKQVSSTWIRVPL